MNIGGASLNQVPLDWNTNQKNILEAISLAKKQKVDLLCLPELCITGYGCEDWFLSDWIYEKAMKVLIDLVPYCENIGVFIGLPIMVSGKRHNATCFIANKKIEGFYAKQFLANDGIHYEKRWFTPWKKGRVQWLRNGNEAYRVGEMLFEYNGKKIGVEICEDAWHDNRPGLRYYHKEVDVLVNPSASHFALGKTIIRDELVVNASNKFECQYVYANLSGNEAGRAIYDGEILIANKGKLIAKNELLKFAHVQLVHTNTPKLANAQSEEIEFEKAVTLGLFDYLRKSKSNGFVLSLSGGADSSCCATMVYLMVKRAVGEMGEEWVKQILGLKNESDDIKQIVQQLLITAYQGTVNSSHETLNSAKELAKEIGAVFHDWKIDEVVNQNIQTIEKAINQKLTWQHHDITLQNVQARSRSPIIWMLANLYNSLLLTTSNRSEGDVGYTTMDGDTSGSIAPIAGIDKDFIRKWLVWAEKEHGINSLQHVNNLQPSAELRPSDKKQSDEDDLMPYLVMKEIEILAIQFKKSPIEVFQILKNTKLIEKYDAIALRQYILKFFRLWSRNQWKRERLAPSFHLDEFNVDPKTWCRFPILNGGFSEELKQLEKLSL